VAATADIRYRSIEQGFGAGLVFTIAVHGAIALVVFVTQIQAPAPPEAARDLIVTQLVSFGNPRPKYWLPRIVQPKPKAPDPSIKLSLDPTAPAKPPPKVDDAEISKDLRRALQRAQALAATDDEPAEGSLTGSKEGTSTQAAVGDEYATAVHEAIRKNWSAPSGLVNDADLARLEVDVRLSIGDDGALLNPHIAKPSGNQFFDDSCIQAVKATGQVPPPPAEVRAKFRRGLLVTFAGKDLAR
jgi:TonB family protein